MKKMLKAAAVLAAILMALTLGACSDGDDGGSGNGGGSSGGGSSYLKIEGNKVTGVHLNKIPSDGKIVIPDGVEEIAVDWMFDEDAYFAHEGDFLPVDKVTSISLPTSLKSFSSVLDHWIDYSVQDQVLDIDIIYRGTLADYCKIEMASYNLRIAKGIKVGNDDLKTVDALVIPDGATEIAKQAFRTLTNIKSVTIPKTVKEIGENAFGEYQVGDIVAVTYKGTLKDWCDIKNDLLLVQAQSIKMSDGKDLKTLTEITANDIAGATKIGDYAFAYCEKLTDVVIPESVTEIGRSVFHSCDALKSMTFEITDGWYQKAFWSYEVDEVVDVSNKLENARLQLSSLYRKTE